MKHVEFAAELLASVRADSAHRRGRHPLGCRGSEERPVPCDDDEVRITNSVGCGEVHCVIAT